MPPRSDPVPGKSSKAPIAKTQILRTLPALRRWRAGLRGRSVALVPTMGALHDGHLTLVRYARRKCDRVVVSIFVNPTQFAPHEDFGSYPRTWDADLAALKALNVDAVWAPNVATMYPEGFATKIAPGGPALAGLEDKFRPHFFGGVCTVVAKLLLQVQPDIATFGEKDYQQLKVVTAMARDLDIATRIAGVPTVREKDGLAMSSRNAYLSPEERAAASTLHRMLKACAIRLKKAEPVAQTLIEGEAEIEQAGFAVDYLEARHAETLARIASIKDGPVRLLVAAKIGRTRLIDNIAV
ncbi:pantoate--beta-alanine ligase [Rhodoplanes sp. Z2-YC6860]|uniref:pantoate--beta-alanine ligase n=1 Tax=Rhodoplanes sp. Z2-YC6860 TaxID=674703 RepID=UPI00078DD38C|nr:pantoate--beta-alanine ligase [Rhodoplanes sp. Z2-YC6860]AMN42484.1 pantoate--beta-alanine ligase [Rhodoplanes sp. Z2-YC6860]